MDCLAQKVGAPSQRLVCGWCVGGVCVMCGESKGKMTELVDQKELRGAMDMGMLWLISAMDL